MSNSNISYLKNYLQNYNSLINEAGIVDSLIQIKDIFLKTSKSGGKIVLAGNGGSAAMASHVAVDLTKNAGVEAITFNEYDLITTLANDYGYDNWIAKAIEFHAKPNDLVVLISASGQSKNVLNAAKKANDIGIQVITFSGFDSMNPLRESGAVNIWVDSPIYNVVEMVHHIWLLAIVDMLIDQLS